MSGARFARSGRARFFMCLLFLLFMLGILVTTNFFHNTQLDKTREKHLACEQQQETLNEQLQTIVEEKYTLQKNYKVELEEQMQTRQDLEQKIKKLEQVAKEQLDSHMQYDKLQQAHKALQSEHREFVKECTKSKEQLLDDTNALNRKMKLLHSKELKEKSVLSSELALWQEKYNTMINEKERLETLLNNGDAKTRLVQLEHILAEYQTHCQYQPKAALSQLLNNKPLDMPQIAPKSSSSKSFNQQIAPQLNKKLAEETINKKAPPLSAPHKPSSTEASKMKQKEEMPNLQMATNKTSRAAKFTVSSTSNMPPLQFPPQVQNQKQQSRKLPDNVAPIPEHFEDLFKSDEQQQQKALKKNAHDNNNKEEVETKGDAAVSEKKKEYNMPVADADNNNRYVNVVKDMDAIANKDSKDNESFMNEQSFNVPNNEDENNFFDAADDTKKNVAVVADAKNKANAADDFLRNGNEAAEEFAADVGDIEVKENKNLLNADNVNNEVAGDQGKEFDDGLNLEEGIEEDADEDDYSHLARQQGEEAIRN